MGILEITLLILAGLIAVLNVLAVLVVLVITSTMQKDIGGLLKEYQNVKESLSSQERILSAVYTTILITYQTLQMIMAMGPAAHSPPSRNPGGQSFATPDGKLQAQSFEELIEKMSNDPQWKGKVNPEDIGELRDLFEDALDDIEEESDDDDEEK